MTPLTLLKLKIAPITNLIWFVNVVIDSTQVFLVMN